MRLSAQEDIFINSRKLAVSRCLSSIERSPTSKSVAHLSLRKCAQHIEVEKGDDRSMVSSQAVLETAMIDCDCDRVERHR